MRGRTNPYLLDRPAVVSFSGGRTSGFMLRQILDAFGGTLPEDVKVLFANTGKERPETLDFVHEIEHRWWVPIVWLEYRRINGRHGYAVVDYATASRDGQPFEAIIDQYRAHRQTQGLPPVLPNPVQRFCTSNLKIRTMRRYMVQVHGWRKWTDAIGLRADEPRRVHRLAAGRRERGEPIAPLYHAGVTESDVMAFWAAQPFNLKLRPDEGNCDLCFLKGRDKIARLIRERPESAEWWAQLEEATGQRFRKDRPGVRELALAVTTQPEFVWPKDERLPECRCTD